MIRYEVTLECSDEITPSLERWMRNTHVPEMLATGCFVAIHFDRAEGRFRTVYQARARQQLDHYLADHADRMRRAFQDEFPAGVAISREVWEELQAWTAT
ncbi:MAG: DUF4286 family protein [Gemmatimonadales bacterium]